MGGLGGKFAEHGRFLRGLAKSPSGVGAVAPTSKYAARRMASVCSERAGLPVLELGPGTGVITSAILETGVAPEELVSIEFSKDFYKRLAEDFPEVGFVQGDAFDLPASLGEHASKQFGAVVSGIPLLTFPKPMRRRLIESALDLMPPGGPFMQLTYGPVSPAPKQGDYEAKSFGIVWRNLPPTRLWIYRRA